MMAYAAHYRAVVAGACLFMLGRCLAQQGASVPIPIQIASGLVYMQGEVNRSGPLTVVLDTGSSRSIVSPSVARAAGLTSSGTTEAAGMGKGAKETLHLFDDSELAWGFPTSQFRLPHQKGAVLSIDYVAEEIGKRTDAIFGGNLFLHYTITVDYLHERATFAPSSERTQDAGTAIPIQLVGDVPFAEATIAGEGGKQVSGLFLLDSGTTGAMILNRKFLETHPGLVAKNHFVDAPAVTAVGGKIHYSRVQLPQISIGPFVFSNVVAGVPDASVGILSNESVAGLIGAGILSRFTVTWDYARKKMSLLPNDTLSEPFETDSSGLHLVAPGPDYRAVIIDSVVSGSPGAAAGLIPGDQIVAINGAGELPLWKVAKILRKPDTTAVLTVKRENRELEVKVRLRSPFPPNA